MDEEIEALKKNQTWDIVEEKRGIKPVGCKWIVVIKYKSYRTLDRYNARLVSKGYTQTYNIDYKETFTLVAKMNTIRILISLAVNLNWELHQFDVKNAFLYGDLEEEIYKRTHPGYELVGNKTKVCKMKKAF